jgi:SiaC family regulatory phosphoprotein
MNDLHIEITQETPEVNFNATTGTLKITGRAYSNDINVFYKRMNSWLDDYLLEAKETTVLELKLDYYNSIFIKLLFHFLEKCKMLTQQNKKLIIKWHHQQDDDDIVEEAIRISKIIEFPIERIPYE